VGPDEVDATLMLALRAEERERVRRRFESGLEVQDVLLLLLRALMPLPLPLALARAIPVLQLLVDKPATNEPPISPAAPPIAIASRRASIDKFKLSNSPCEILRCSRSIERWRVRSAGFVEYWRVFQGGFIAVVVVLAELRVEVEVVVDETFERAEERSRLRLWLRRDEDKGGSVYESRSNAPALISRSHCKWFCLFASTGFSFSIESFRGSYGPSHFCRLASVHWSKIVSCGLWGWTPKRTGPLTVPGSPRTGAICVRRVARSGTGRRRWTGKVGEERRVVSMSIVEDEFGGEKSGETVEEPKLFVTGAAPLDADWMLDAESSG